MTAIRVTLRPIGHPLPLGFLGLAVATLTVSGLQLGWIPKAQGAEVGLVLIAFVFPTQLLSSIFGYLGRDSVAGTSMAILAGAWLTQGLVLRSAPPGTTNKAIGLFLFIAAISMLVPAVGASAGKLVPTLVLATTALRFAATAGYQWTASSSWKGIAGAIGVVLGALAVYAALAIELEESRGRTVLPIARRQHGAEATHGDLHDQVHDIEHAPGVRRQL